MLSEFLRHLRYFLPRLLGFGLVLGALFGALSYPILGGIIGAPWGLVGGLLLAPLLSIFITIYERRFPEEDEAKHQANLSLAMGVATTVVMAIPLLFIFAPVAGLTVSYLVHNYTDSAEYRGEKRKSDSQDPYQRRRGAFTRISSEMLSSGKWVVFLGTAVSGLLFLGFFFLGISISGTTAISALLSMILFSIFAMMYGFLVSLPIAFANGFLVHFMNRLYFKPEMTKEQYKARIVPMVAILTLFTSAIVTFGLGAPFASIAAGVAASKYADWYYEEEEKPKRAARLEDDLSDEEDESQEEEEAIQSHEDRL